MTEWERTGDTKYRDKIIAGMDSIAAMPFGFLTGPNQLYGYDPKTGKLYPLLAEQVWAPTTWPRSWAAARWCSS